MKRIYIPVEFTQNGEIIQKQDGLGEWIRIENFIENTVSYYLKKDLLAPESNWKGEII